MKEFMDKDFLLESEMAKKLFHNHAADMPIFDYHCHLIPEQIAEDKRFTTITDAWLGGDHYKWRQMRTCGFDEKLVTGDADPFDKFMAWAETMENLIGNPLYDRKGNSTRGSSTNSEDCNESYARGTQERLD